MNENIFKHTDITSSILRGYYEVYNELGHGFLESVYENALCVVLTEYGLSIERQKEISVYFRGSLVGSFTPDMIVDEKVIVEIKAAENLVPAHESLVINYLRATEIEVGLLLNFGKKPEIKRCAYDNQRKQIREIL